MPASSIVPLSVGHAAARGCGTGMSPSNLKAHDMKFCFSKIGPIKQAELRLGDLTVIAGKNNTGKTYLVYTLYGFLRMWQQWPGLADFLMSKKSAFMSQENLANFRKKGEIRYTLNRRVLNQQRNIIIERLARSFSEEALHGVFSSQRSEFKSSSMRIDLEALPESLPPVGFEYDTGDAFTARQEQDTIVISREKIAGMGKEHIPHILAVLHSRFLFPEFPDPFILSAERFGISLFHRELDFTKNRLVDMLQKIGDDRNGRDLSPFYLIDKTTSRYAMPIKDNIDYTRSLPDIRAKKSALHGSMLQKGVREMMRGYYASTGDEIRFRSVARKPEAKFDIPLHLASSSARGLSDLYFFLHHQAHGNHLLIIDEPESHLDTGNQILLARLLARMVHAGVKVLITTHSDYLLKEINNLILLGQELQGKEEAIRQYRYAPDEYLPEGSVQAYTAEHGGLTECAIDRFGIDMPVFDETIDDINKISNDLATRVRPPE